MFNQYPSMIEEERESYVTTSNRNSIYELSADQSPTKVNVKASEENRRAAKENRQASAQPESPSVPRKSPLKETSSSGFR